MKSKKLLSLLLALAMVMSMAACGAKTNEPPATSGTPSETGAPATEELNWPTKEITLIQPWSLGGGPDVITRQIASYSDKILGVPMIVENHTGGSGTIGMNDFLEAEDNQITEKEAVLMKEQMVQCVRDLEAVRLWGYDVTFFEKDYHQFPVMSMILSYMKILEGDRRERFETALSFVSDELEKGGWGR